MSLNWTVLTETDYKNLRWDLLVKVEESGHPQSLPYLDSDDPSNPTTGVGFNLKDSFVRNEVLKTLGFNNPFTDPDELRYMNEIRDIVTRFYQDTAADKARLQADLNGIMSRRFADPAIPAANRTHATFAFASVDEIRATFDRIIEQFDGPDGAVNRWLPGIPLSRERLALASLAYNNAGKLLGPGLKGALATGDRAEAWYEIRYGSNGDREPGIAKRRYYEAEVFGLYDDNALPPQARETEYLDVYRMLTRHRAAILDYENRYGETATRNMRAEAESDYAADVASLRESLAPAGSYLLSKHAPAGFAAIDLMDIRVGQDVAYAGREAGRARTWCATTRSPAAGPTT